MTNGPTSKWAASVPVGSKTLTKIRSAMLTGNSDLPTVPEKPPSARTGKVSSNGSPARSISGVTDHGVSPAKTVGTAPASAKISAIPFCGTRTWKRIGSTWPPGATTVDVEKRHSTGPPA